MELLVVITIIAILAAILLPTIKVVRTTAYSMACLNNLRQMGMSVNAYAVDFGVLPANYRELDNAPGVWRVWALTQAATYLDSQMAGSDGNAAKMDVLKCPGDKRLVTSADESIVHHSITADTLMQCTWISNGDQNWSGYTRLWASYASNHSVFTGKRGAVSPEIALFWDSWTFTSQDNWTVPGTARHNRNTNMVFRDGHAAGVTSAWMQLGRAWNLVPWMGAGISTWPDPILYVGTSYPAAWTNINQPPWKGQ